MRRVILDLSHPEGASVNFGIPRDTYLGVPYKLHLPSAQDLRGLIVSQGQGCHLWSVDLQRGYRQLRVCPMDWPLLGIAWNGAFYFDMTVPFGIRWGAMYMQCTTSAVTRLAGHEGIPCIAYIDDVASAQSPGDAIRGKRRFQSLLRELGLQENISKGSEPSTRMTWLGVGFDSEAMTMSVPTIKINECLRMACSWATKEYCTKSQLRKFLGKLFHICQCCPTSRLFVNRLLETLRSSPEHGRHPIGPAFKADIHWISQYLPLYNGIQMIPRNPTLDTPISVDSCLTGGGGHFGNRIYYTAYPEFILQQALNISELEKLNALIAIKLWAPMLSNHVVRLQCDNSAALSVLQLGPGVPPSCCRVHVRYGLTRPNTSSKSVWNTSRDLKTLWPTSSAAITVTRPAVPGLMSLLLPQIPHCTMWTHIYSNYPDVFRISNHFAFIQSICQVHDID